jgi:hypothetical protein
LEQFSNTPYYGCRECSKKVSQKRSKNINEYIRILLKAYPYLTPEWYKNTPNICSISNMPLNEENNIEWRVSIQNNGLTKEHLPENCVKIAYEFNVQEQNAIPNLIECWKIAFDCIMKELINPTDTTELIKEVEKWWNNSVTENGIVVQSTIIENNKIKRNPEYSKQYNTKHLKSIIQQKVYAAKRQDTKSKRDPKLGGICININQFYEKLLEQKFKCFYTGIPFSTNRDSWNYFSLERIDNKLNHTFENTVFICRMFNTAGQLNRSKILTALLNQKHIQLSLEVINIIKKELNIFL